MNILRCLLGGLLIVTSGCVSANRPPLISAEAAAEQIKHFYETRGDELEPQKRAHFKLRLYRSSGDPKYLEDIQRYAQSLRSYLKIHNSRLSEPRYVETTALKLLNKEGPGQKHQMRRRVLERYPEFPFYHRLIYLFYQLKGLGFDVHSPLFKTSYEALQKYDFRSVLRDREIIAYYAAGAATTVYHLKSIGIADFEAEFLKYFQELFMADPDVHLGAVEYENKLYGLTHIIIAASDYYQHEVPAEEFRWVLDYFSTNINEILSRTKWDVIAEVGLCFRLAGMKNHPVISKTRGAILRGFDPEKGMIPGKMNPLDLNRLEHRNILSYLLLKDFDRFYSGPVVVGEN
ncbi:MAG TPA: DUF3541 domain-containing protein [Xanthomonadales bacterium]|nr:DUF3541 domain-containing protein [Xanthomonadales bacterium]